jgi:excinuclease UvrABC nuclease subunit
MTVNQKRFCVYIGITFDEQPGYVGMTHDFKRRVAQHSKSPFSVVITEWRVLAEFETEIEARAYEYTAIAEYSPIYNRRNNPRVLASSGTGDPFSLDIRSALLETYGSIRAAARELAIPFATLDRRLNRPDSWTLIEIRRISAGTRKPMTHLLRHFDAVLSDLEAAASH